MPRKLTAIQLWDEARSAQIATAFDLLVTFQGRTLKRSLGSPDELRLTYAMPGDPDRLLTTKRRLLRLTYDSGADDWFRITNLDDEFSGVAPASLRAEAMIADLKDIPAEFRTSGGVRSTSVTFSGITAVEALGRICDPGYGAPGWAAAGSVSAGLASREVFLAVENASLMDLLVQLCDQLDRAEWYAVWTGAAYEIHLTERIGASDPGERYVQVTNRQHLRRLQDATDYFSRVRPVAGDQEQGFITLARAWWKVTNAVYNGAGGYTDLTISGGPVWANSALVGRRFKAASGTTYPITASTAPGTVRVAGNASAVTRGRFVEADGADMLDLADVAAEAALGAVTRREAYDQVSPSPNLLAEADVSADFSTWLSAGAVKGWSGSAGVTFSQETDPLYVRYGTRSARVTLPNVGSYAQTDALAFSHADGFGPVVSAWIQAMLIQGKIRLEIIDHTGKSYPYGSKADSNVTEFRGVAIDGEQPPEGTLRLRITAEAASTIAILDAATLCPSAQHFEYQPQMGPAALWKEAARILLAEGGITPDAFDGTIWELAALDPLYDEVTLGDAVNVEDEGLTPFVTRVVEVEEDLTPGEATLVKRITLSRQKADFALRFFGGPSPAGSTPRNPNSSIVLPTIKQDVFQDGDLLVARLTPYDPSGLISSFEYAAAVGANLEENPAYTAKAAELDGSYLVNVGLVPKHTSTIGWRFVLRAPFQALSGTITGDADIVPRGAYDITYRYDAGAGGVLATLICRGDEDTGSFVVQWTRGGDTLTKTVNARTAAVEINTGFPMSTGEAFQVEATAWSGLNGTGTPEDESLDQTYEVPVLGTSTGGVYVPDELVVEGGVIRAPRNPLPDALLLWNEGTDQWGSMLDGGAFAAFPVADGLLQAMLNADMLDGYHAGNGAGNVPVSNGTLNVNLNAQYLGGYEAADFPRKAENAAVSGLWSFAQRVVASTLLLTASVIQRPDNAGAAIHVGNGVNTFYGQQDFYNTGGTSLRGRVTDAGDWTMPGTLRVDGQFTPGYIIKFADNEVRDNLIDLYGGDYLLGVRGSTWYARSAQRFRFDSTSGGGNRFEVGPTSGGNYFSINDIGVATFSNSVHMAGNLLPTAGYTYSIGNDALKWLSLHVAEIRAEILVADERRITTNGRLTVAYATPLTSVISAGAGSIPVQHNSMLNGDIVFFEKEGQFEAMRVTSSYSGSGPYSYNVTRNLDGTGANNLGEGDAAFNTGQPGNGFIDMYAKYSLLDRAAGVNVTGPAIVFWERTSTAWNGISYRAVLGNLRDKYGYGASNIYGAAFGDPSASNITIDPTQGLRIRHGSSQLAQVAAGMFVFGNGSVNTLVFTGTQLTGQNSSGSAIWGLGTSNYIGPWTFTNDALTNNSIYIGRNFEGLQSAGRLFMGDWHGTGAYKVIRQYGPATNSFINLYYSTGGTWGLEGYLDGTALFQLGSTNQIAGWGFDGGEISNGVTNAVNTVHVGLRATASQAGANNYSSTLSSAQGLELQWLNSGNAGSLIVGHTRQPGSPGGFSNYWGLQMLTYTGEEYFALAADPTVSGSNTLRAHIAGWNFNWFRLWSGNIELNTSGYIRHTSDHWRFNSDGSGRLAQGNITWDTSGLLNVYRITATGGAIGAFSIDANRLYYPNLVYIGNQVGAHNGTHRILLGNWDNGSLPIMRVLGSATNTYIDMRADGVNWGLYGYVSGGQVFGIGAGGAMFSGAVTASTLTATTSGTIANWAFNSSYLNHGNVYIGNNLTSVGLAGRLLLGNFSSGATPLLRIYGNSTSDYIQNFFVNSADWGFQAVSGGVVRMHLGSSNYIQNLTINGALDTASGGYLRNSADTMRFRDNGFWLITAMGYATSNSINFGSSYSSADSQIYRETGFGALIINDTSRVWITAGSSYLDTKASAETKLHGNASLQLSSGAHITFSANFTKQMHWQPEGALDLPYTPYTSVANPGGSRIKIHVDAGFIYWADGGNRYVAQRNTASDARLKWSLQPIGGSVIERFMLIDVLSFYYSEYAITRGYAAPSNPRSRKVGVLAQDVLQQFPELVVDPGEGYLTINDNGFIPYLLQADKEIYRGLLDFKEETDVRVSALEERVSLLENRLAAFGIAA